MPAVIGYTERNASKTLTSKRIVVATIGSLGDLHPCLALALELQRRGHQVTIASSQFYRAKVEELGISFHSMRPHWAPDGRELIRLYEDMRKGPEVLFRELILPELRGTYNDLLAIASGADLVIAGEAVYAAPLIAEKLGLKWVSAVLYPMSFFSAYDPSLLVFAPELIYLRKAGLTVNQALLKLGRFATKHWCEPVQRLRKELGLREECDPLFRDKFSPDLVLALFSRWLAEAQPDWPSQTMQGGYVFYDRESSRASTPPELTAFLAAGEAPIVFTLGSLAVHNQGSFAEINRKRN